MDWATHTRRIINRLGVDTTYTPAGGGGSSTVRGIYLQPYQQLFGGIVGSSDPSIACMVADVPTIKGGAQFVIAGATWKVKPAPETDPVSGVVVAKLEKQ